VVRRLCQHGQQKLEALGKDKERYPLFPAETGEQHGVGEEGIRSWIESIEHGDEDDIAFLGSAVATMNRRLGLDLPSSDEQRSAKGRAADELPAEGPRAKGSATEQQLRSEPNRPPNVVVDEGKGVTKHVFLSYCRDNDEPVRQLYDEVTAAGHEVWRDQERLLPGMDWRHEIRLAIRRAYAVVICFSREVAARHRSGIYPEALLAIEEYRTLPPGSIYLIPVRLSECEIPSIELTPTRTLQDLHREDLFPPERRPQGLGRLLEALAAAKRERGE
jgi:hypothetical protein